MPKGHKRTKGVPELHNELKTRVNLSLTPTAVEGLDNIAAEFGISRSELVEQIGRGKLEIAKKQLFDSSSPQVRDFLEKAARRFPKGYVDITSVGVVLFKDRKSLPNSPGAYIVSDWNFDFQGVTDNLGKLFRDEFQLAFVKMHFEQHIDETCFILWMTCKDRQELSYVQRQLSSLMLTLQNEVMARQLAKMLWQQNQTPQP